MGGRMSGAASWPMVLVTGLSGAGMSTALKALEDQGYEAIDNLPLTFVETVAEVEALAGRPLAVGVDARTRDFGAGRLLTLIENMQQRRDLRVSLLFLDADDDVLLRRFTETRRRHPLALDRPVIDGIRTERLLLEPVRRAADLIIDTSRNSIHDTRRLVSAQYALADAPTTRVFVVSFSFREGLPREADMVFDARFLRNPHYEPDLQAQTGRDSAVARFVEADPDFCIFLDGIKTLLMPLLPRYASEGKAYLTVAIGCTGGRHRSVLTAERLAAWIAQQGYTVGLRHRELV
jgi:RNase adapter protein RapZ